jgi:lipopolysaccharide biosynthesis glycosyltransferase
VSLHVAVVTDRSYLPWCATALRSCAETTRDDLALHVVHDGSLTADDARRLALATPGAELRLHAVEPADVAHLPALDRFGHVVWLRFLLPDLLPDADRALYLDADTLVVDDLAPLAAHDLQGAPFGAVPNVAPDDERRRLTTLGVPADGAALNSGVLLLDLDRLREEGFATRAAELCAERGHELRWPDQDVLNLLYAGRWHRLHGRYNAQNSFFEWQGLARAVLGEVELAEALARPAVVHFEGPYVCKPWHVLCEHPWRDRYRATLARTPWAGAPLDDDGRATRAIARLPRAWRIPVYEQVVRARHGHRPSLRSMVRSARRRAAERSDVQPRSSST